jgi:hypothetical protein
MSFDDLMKQFRLASRELFNHYFRISDSHVDDQWVSVERFRELQSLLFRKLVSETASLDICLYGDVQPGIMVELRDGVSAAPIMLNRDIDSGYWDHPLVEVPGGAGLVFLSSFDWDQMYYRDNQYTRVQVRSWSSHPEVVGKHALIESQYVRFVKATGS